MKLFQWKVTFVNYFPMPGAKTKITKIYSLKTDNEKQAKNEIADNMHEYFGDNAWGIDNIELINNPKDNDVSPELSQLLSIG